MTNSSDHNLIEGIRKGDMDSFRKLFDEKYSLFYVFIKGLVKNSLWAEDITQNIFLKVWVNRAKLNPEQSIHNYLYVLARNEVRDHFRLKSNMSYQAIQEDHKVYSEDFAGEIDVKMISDQIDQIVLQMPEQRQKVFVLSRKKMLSNKEIANNLNLSVRTVERHIFLAMREIKRHLPAYSSFLMLFMFLKS
uniref:RNA polymerase sigma-70 factor n=1 Tax=uncultured Draconibacterium sp. TaxID=1573823 RepID=UPI003216C6F9